MKRLFKLLVFVLFISCEAVFLEDISDKIVTILAPKSQSKTTEGVINFSWESLEDASAYRIQVTTPSFEKAGQIVSDTIVAENTFSKNLIAGEYEWRVKALNSEFQTKYTLSRFRLTKNNSKTK